MLLSIMRRSLGFALAHFQLSGVGSLMDEPHIFQLGQDYSASFVGLSDRAYFF
ncbi:hypothetical protein JYQ62_31760 [Nostoc sp. UHCC 0702]|nr:hypothetical protein JYQ62_31760 [Nostoc sp. UHCC 0702]